MIIGYIYIIAKETIKLVNTAVKCLLNNATNIKVIFKNFAPFTNWISRRNNRQEDDDNLMWQIRDKLM